ncbi:fidgetin 1 [Octopus vulgaris]|uniref:Fidgetin-like protein 1 n=1 Tax=Octopus vulgaris TaxID=6645 RepID=A0AA36B6F7_OCTVU|nr:fidgetin 1 [Octopus vulgaris]
MEFDEPHASFLSYFQKLYFDDKLQNGTPSEKADILRNLIVQITLAARSNLISCEAAKLLLADYNNKYVAIVDNFDTTQGLNNFAGGALHLCNRNRNESANWKSSLTPENVLDMECLKQIRKESKESSGRFSQPPEEKPYQSVSCKELPIPSEAVKDTTSMVNHSLDKLVTHKDENVPPSVKNVNKVNNVNNTSCFKTNNGLSQNHSNFKKLTAFTTIGQNSNCNNSSKDMKTSPSPFPEHRDTVSNLGSAQQNFQFSTKNQSNQNTVGSYSERMFPEKPVADQPVNRSFFSKKPLFSKSVTPAEEPNASFGANQFPNRRNRPSFWKSGHYNSKGASAADVYDDDDDTESDNMVDKRSSNFRTAREQLVANNMKKYGRGGNNGSNGGAVGSSSYGSAARKCLGTRRGLNSKFIPPVPNKEDNYDRMAGPKNNEENEFIDERLKGPPVSWNDIAGLEFAKKNIQEIVVWPMLRPDIFTGLRGPPKGLLLFGPPGTGKTLIGKCIASQSKSTFFSISASSLTSKWVGEGEKTVRTLFAVSRCYQPAVIFIDEIDSLLSQRSDNEHESSRRIKTEFLVQLDGATTDSEERLLVIGATNRPQEIDEAARRRFVRRLYIPLPEKEARKTIVENLLREQQHSLTPEELDQICDKSKGYSGADMTNLCREAALGPIRSLSFGDIENISADQVRPIQFSDFEDALIHVKASVSPKDLEGYIVWNSTFGSGGRSK